MEDCGQPTKQGKTKCVAFTHSLKIIQFSVPVLVHVPVYFSFWFRFWLKIFKYDFGLVPVSADILVPVNY